MQSGISASPTLQTHFRTFLTDPSLFALLITITAERLERLETLPSTPTNNDDDDDIFFTSLPTLTPHLLPTRALYILLRRHRAPHHPCPLTCITYVPDAAPVRQKTLFASTRLTLVRELGAELFGEGMFATEQRDLRREGWGKWERGLEAAGTEVMSREERELEGVRSGEGGAVGERKMVGMGGSAVGMKVGFGEGVVEALRGMREGEGLVMLVCEHLLSPLCLGFFPDRFRDFPFSPVGVWGGRGDGVGGKP